MSLIKKILSFFNKKKNIEPDPMKYLIVGLGNLHPDYDETRHNVGFEVVDAIANEFGAKWEHKQLAEITEVKFKGRTLVLAKPSTYMNRSGKPVRYWMQQYKILKPNLLIVLDDLNIDFGKLRLRQKGKDGGHNGLKDINQFIGSDYARLRVGIGNNFSKGKQVDFVLGKWSNKEMEDLTTILKKAVRGVKNYCTIGPQFTQNGLNNPLKDA